jgi:PAS domain S-box-containing protein
MAGAVAAAVALLAIWFAAPELGLTWFDRSAPLGTVAPAVAVVITLFAGLIIYVQWAPRRATLDAAALVLLGTVALLAANSGLHNLRSSSGVSWSETAVAHLFPAPGDGLPRRLSVFAAAAIVSTACCLSLHLTTAIRRPRWRRRGAALAVLTATLLLYSAASRYIGVTLIAPGGLAPSFWTAAALGLINVALAASFHGFHEAKYLLAGSDPEACPTGSPDHHNRAGPLVAVLLGSLGLTALAVLWYLNSHFTQTRQEHATFLAQIARLQATELETWRRERLGDAIVLQHAPSLALALAANPAATSSVSAYFDAFRGVFHYAAIALLDDSLTLRLHSGPSELATALTADARQSASHAGNPRCFDPVSTDEAAIWLGLLAPLTLPGAEAPAGQVALRINARPQLAAMQARWAVAGAATVILRRQAGGIRYVGDPGPEPPLSQPASVPPVWDTLAAAVEHVGEFDLAEFRDHRDVPVLAVARRVPDSPWILAVKLDRATADARVRFEAWRLGAGFLGVSAVLGLVTQSIWRRRRDQLERQHLRAERERHAAVERLAGVAALVPGVVYQYQLLPDGRTCFPYASDAIRQIYRVSPEELRTDASPVTRILHPDDSDRILASVLQSARTLEPWNEEYRVRFDDGTERWLHGQAVPRADADGSVLWHGFITDITARKRVDEALHESLREKEALLKEVHHRVKNNLQVVSSLLRMEARRNRDSAAASTLHDMMGRVHSMALLHEALYRSGTFAAVDLATYIRRIAVESQRAAAGYSGTVRLQLELDSVQVELDRALPCGLLLNELVSNAYKHGFPGGTPGEIRVLLQPAGPPAHWRLRVSDNGVGLPADLDTRRRNSLGLELVTDLAGQLGGRLVILPGPGAGFEVIFPVQPLTLPPGAPAPG